MRYRKKPIVIEAFQMTKANRPDVGLWPQWLLDAWGRVTGQNGSVWPSADHDDGTLAISTLEGILLVSEDDWIIKGIANELYPCKPDIFAATYETVGMPPAGMPNHDRRGVEQAPFFGQGETVTPDAA